MGDRMDDTTALWQALAGRQDGQGAQLAAGWLSQLRAAGVPDRAARECLMRVFRLRETAQRDGWGWTRWLYPLIVVGMAGLLLWWYATFTYPVMAAFAQSLQLHLPGWLAGVVWLASWTPVLALVAVLLPYFSRKWPGQRSGGPGAERSGNGSRRDQLTRNAMLCELMAVLVEHQVPPREAQSIASELAGHPPGRGGDGRMASSGFANLPPLLATSLVELDGSPQLAGALHDVGSTYDRLAWDDVRRWRGWLPAVAGLAAAGLATLAYALLLFVPLVDMLKQLVVPLVSGG